MTRKAKPRQNIRTLVTQLAEPVLAEMGIELVETEYVKEGPNWFLRIFIDHPDGINLDICQEVSNKIGPLLDKADFIVQNYFLEISSPGLERPLKKEADFWRYQGNKIQVTTYTPVKGEKKLEGILKGLVDGQMTLEIKTGSIVIPLSQVASARLKVDI